MPQKHYQSKMQSESEDSFFSESENFIENLKKNLQFINLQSSCEGWISGLIDFSSQYGNDNSISYSAINVLGKPHKVSSELGIENFPLFFHE